MDKATVILELLKSLNSGNSGYVEDRVYYAIMQYDDLVKKGIIKEETSK